MNAERKAQALEIVAREALYLDEQRWHDWLDLYAEDAVLWVPTWRNESELVDDPMTELSFMYLDGRAFLHERVQRVVSGRSIASLPIPRTAHLVSPALAESDDEGRTVTVKSAWHSSIYLHKEAGLVSYAGRYEHQLVRRDDDYRIRKKKIVIINDCLQSQVDFFYI